MKVDETDAEGDSICERQHQIELQMVAEPAGAGYQIRHKSSKSSATMRFSGPPLDELNLRMIGSIEADITGLGFLNIGGGKET